MGDEESEPLSGEDGSFNAGKGGRRDGASPSDESFSRRGQERSMRVLTMELTGDGKVWDVSPGLKRLLGYPKNTLIQKDLLSEGARAVRVERLRGDPHAGRTCFSRISRVVAGRVVPFATMLSFGHADASIIEAEDRPKFIAAFQRTLWQHAQNLEQSQRFDDSDSDSAPGTPKCTSGPGTLVGLVPTPQRMPPRPGAFTAQPATGALGFSRAHRSPCAMRALPVVGTRASAPGST